VDDDADAEAGTGDTGGAARVGDGAGLAGLSSVRRETGADMFAAPL
jgi:hypothetical protein